MKKLRWNATYFCMGIFLTIIEVLIALYVHDDFVRPVFGDVLVVFVLYCFVNSFSCLVSVKYNPSYIKSTSMR